LLFEDLIKRVKKDYRTKHTTIWASAGDAFPMVVVLPSLFSSTFFAIARLGVCASFTKINGRSQYCRVRCTPSTARRSPTRRPAGPNHNDQRTAAAFFVRSVDQHHGAADLPNLVQYSIRPFRRYSTHIVQ